MKTILEHLNSPVDLRAETPLGKLSYLVGTLADEERVDDVAQLLKALLEFSKHEQDVKPEESLSDACERFGLTKAAELFRNIEEGQPSLGEAYRTATEDAEAEAEPARRIDNKPQRGSSRKTSRKRTAKKA